MKAVILAGGYGTRLAEESGVRPKPMVEVGGYPILWHIMKIYSHYGIADFVVCCGYKGDLIKDYFAHLFTRSSDITFDLRNNSMEVHHSRIEPWRVTLVDTGDGTMTGGRLRRVREYVGDETFAFTYGDGVGDMAIDRLMAFHAREGVQATLTAVQPLGRFGSFRLPPGDNRIAEFREKSTDQGSWINAGFFLLEPAVFDYLDGDDTVFEKEPLEKLAHAGQLAAYRHHGFWQPMDTLHDKNLLESLWREAHPPWKIWQD